MEYENEVRTINGFLKQRGLPTITIDNWMTAEQAGVVVRAAIEQIRNHDKTSEMFQRQKKMMPEIEKIMEDTLTCIEQQFPRP